MMKRKFYVFLMLPIFTIACLIPGLKTTDSPTPLSENTPVIIASTIDINNPYDLEFGEAKVDANPIGLNMRTEPNEHGDLIMTIPDSEIVEIDGIFKNGWVSLCYKEQCGYANGKFISQTPK